MTVPMPPVPPVGAARRILVVKLDAAGDFLLSTPFLRGLRTSAPAARIVLAVRGAVADLAAPCPHVDGVVVPAVTDGPEGARLDVCGVTPNGRALFAEGFRGGFDRVIVARYDCDTHGAATLAAHVPARVRLGFGESVTPWKAEMNAGFDRALTHALGAQPGRHEVERLLALLEAAGGQADGTHTELYLTQPDVDAAATLLAPLGDGPVLAVAPGAASARRVYPAPSLAAVAAALARRMGAGIAVVGGPEDGEAARALAHAFPGPVADLTGRTAVRTAAAVIARADALLAMDSAPAHMAAACGTPVAVFSCHLEGGDPEHFHAPERFRPWTPRALVLRPARGRDGCAASCTAAEAHCIATIRAADAYDRIAGFLGLG